MLCQFTFRNYRSFRDETEFSMQATKMKEFGDSLIPGGDGQSFLPVAVVYGPNAGGKSNFAEALQYVCSAVALPIVRLLSGDENPPKKARMAKCSPFVFEFEFLMYLRTVGSETPVSLEISATVAPPLAIFLISCTTGMLIISFLTSFVEDGTTTN